MGFEDAVRSVVVQAVKAAFRRIGSERLGTYLDLKGICFATTFMMIVSHVVVGDDLANYVQNLGWSTDASTGVVTLPSNPDNQIESTVVQENIQLSRTFIPSLFRILNSCKIGTELVKVIMHSQTA